MHGGKVGRNASGGATGSRPRGLAWPQPPRDGLWWRHGPRGNASGGEDPVQETDSLCSAAAPSCALTPTKTDEPTQTQKPQSQPSFKGRLGKAEGIVAGAHKLAKIIWAAITTGQPYDETKAFQLTPAGLTRRLKNLQNQAQALNMKLVPA